MCGFLVLASVEPDRPLPHSDADLDELRDTLRHRGPDAAGRWMEASRTAALLHRRLKVIDLQGGHQPMICPEGRFCLVHNGEVYNYRELRADLEDRGHLFRTQSDTEVLLTAYRAWGPECVRKLNGIFAFAVWDREERTLFLARDPLGVEPLYYGVWNGILYAASEAKAIVADARVPRAVDPRAIDLYFHLGYVPEPQAIWAGMRKMGPGCRLTLKLSGSMDALPATERYWTVPFGQARPLEASGSELLDAVDSALRRAVRRQTVSDVPLGAFLSGGIDSSLVVSYLAELSDAPVQTFSVSLEGAPYDEAPYAQQISREYGTRHHRVVVTPDALDLLPELAHFYDEPFADPAALPTAVLSALAREHVTVVLSGDGGDETYAGYPRYLRAYQSRLLDRVPQGLRRAAASPFTRIASSYMRRGAFDVLGLDATDRYAVRTVAVPRVHRWRAYSDQLREKIAADPAGWNGNGASPWQRSVLDELPPGTNVISRLQFLDIRTYLSEQLMVKLNRASMRSSLEARVPLLDLDAVALAARIPAPVHIRDGRPKYVLRRLLAQRMGKDFVRRRKQGFRVPARSWLESRDRAWLERLLLPTGIDEWLDRDRTRSLLLDDPKGRRLLWPFVMFGAWFRAYRPPA
jgi:asparagine synthase (glutamine-hydrolysing)